MTRTDYCFCSTRAPAVIKHSGASTCTVWCMWIWDLLWPRVSSTKYSVIALSDCTTRKWCLAGLQEGSYMQLSNLKWSIINLFKVQIEICLKGLFWVFSPWHTVQLCTVKFLKQFFFFLSGCFLSYALEV